MSKFFLDLDDKLSFCEFLAHVDTIKRETNYENVRLNYLAAPVTFAMASHCLVIALLSAWPINQRWTAPLFNVIPTIPPFTLESLKNNNRAIYTSENKPRLK